MFYSIQQIIKMAARLKPPSKAASIPLPPREMWNSPETKPIDLQSVLAIIKYRGTDEVVLCYYMKDSDEFLFRGQRVNCQAWLPIVRQW